MWGKQYSRGCHYFTTPTSLYKTLITTRLCLWDRQGNAYIGPRINFRVHIPRPWKKKKRKRKTQNGRVLEFSCDGDGPESIVKAHPSKFKQRAWGMGYDHPNFCESHLLPFSSVRLAHLHLLFFFLLSNGDRKIHQIVNNHQPTFPLSMSDSKRRLEDILLLPHQTLALDSSPLYSTN